VATTTTAIPERAEVRVGNARIYVLHNLAELDLDPERAGFDAVICGHSHRPSSERRGTVWFVNPGSAGPRRFQLPIAVAQLEVKGRELTARLITLEVAIAGSSTAVR